MERTHVGALMGECLQQQRDGRALALCRPCQVIRDALGNDPALVVVMLRRRPYVPPEVKRGGPVELNTLAPSMSPGTRILMPAR